MATDWAAPLELVSRTCQAMVPKMKTRPPRAVNPGRVAKGVSSVLALAPAATSTNTALLIAAPTLSFPIVTPFGASASFVVVTDPGPSMPATMPASEASLAVAMLAATAMFVLSICPKMASRSESRSAMCHGCVACANSFVFPSFVTRVAIYVPRGRAATRRSTGR